MSVDVRNEKNEKFKVLQNSLLGRYAVAGTDLKADELIHEELPFVVGPKSNSRVVCLECYCSVDGSVGGPRCDLCNWPICLSCNAEYKRNGYCSSYHQSECKIFSESGIKFQPVDDSFAPCAQYECITPLRLLLAIEANPEKYESEISPMEYHDEARRNSPFWEIDQVNIVNNLLGPCKLSGRFKKEMIERVIGILDVNVFEAKTIHGDPVRCLYPLFGVVAHSCVPNTSHSIRASEGFKFQAYTLVDIPKDECIYAIYTYTLSTTNMRQKHLQKSKFFTCQCNRCLDPTELGTNLSSFKCMKCDTGIVLPTNPIDKTSDWICLNCGTERYGRDINKCVELMQKEIDNLLKFEMPARAAYELENMFNAYKMFLHDQHYIMQTIRFNLITLYGYTSEADGNESRNLRLERKIEYCDCLLNLISVIEPGKTRLYAELLHEKLDALHVLAEDNFKTKKITEVQYKYELDRILKFMRECVFVWEREDPNSQTGILLKTIRKRSKEIETQILEL